METVKFIVNLLSLIYIISAMYMLGRSHSKPSKHLKKQYGKQLEIIEGYKKLTDELLDSYRRLLKAVEENVSDSQFIKIHNETEEKDT